MFYLNKILACAYVGFFFLVLKNYRVKISIKLGCLAFLLFGLTLEPLPDCRLLVHLLHAA